MKTPVELDSQILAKCKAGVTLCPSCGRVPMMKNVDNLFSLPFLMVPLVLIVRKEGSPNQGRLTVKPGQLILQVHCVLHAHHSQLAQLYWCIGPDITLMLNIYFTST